VLHSNSRLPNAAAYAQNDPGSFTYLPITSAGFFSSGSSPTCANACCLVAFFAAGVPRSTPLPAALLPVGPLGLVLAASQQLFQFPFTEGFSVYLSK